MHVELKVNQQLIIVDTDKVDQSWLNHCLAYGVRRFINDKYSGMEGQTKYELCMALAKDMTSGEKMPEVVRGMGGRITDPVEALAVKNAKSDLTAIFRVVTKMTKGADMAKHEKVAPFFKVTDDKAVWIDATVKAWMDKQKADGKADYMEAAKTTLGADIEEAVSELDF